MFCLGYKKANKSGLPKFSILMVLSPQPQFRIFWEKKKFLHKDLFQKVFGELRLVLIPALERHFFMEYRPERADLKWKIARWSMATYTQMVLLREITRLSYMVM